MPMAGKGDLVYDFCAELRILEVEKKWIENVRFNLSKLLFFRLKMVKVKIKAKELGIFWYILGYYGALRGITRHSTQALLPWLK